MINDEALETLPDLTAEADRQAKLAQLTQLKADRLALHKQYALPPNSRRKFPKEISERLGRLTEQIHVLDGELNGWGKRYSSDSFRIPHPPD